MSFPENGSRPTRREAVLYKGVIARVSAQRRRWPTTESTPLALSVAEAIPVTASPLAEDKRTATVLKAGIPHPTGELLDAITRQ
jgi:hypothetical protein